MCIRLSSLICSKKLQTQFVSMTGEKYMRSIGWDCGIADELSWGWRSCCVLSVSVLDEINMILSRDKVDTEEWEALSKSQVAKKLLRLHTCILIKREKQSYVAGRLIEMKVLQNELVVVEVSLIMRFLLNTFCSARARVEELDARPGGWQGLPGNGRVEQQS